MLLESNPLLRSALINSHRELSDIANEDLIDLQMSIMEKQEAHSHVVKCHSLLKLNSNSLTSLLIYKIPLTAFKIMFDEATSKRKNLDRYITAVKIFMASDGTKMTPIFQPVYLKQKAYDPATQKDLYQIPLYGNGSYYTFNGTSTFDKIIDDNIRVTKVNNYTNNTPPGMTLIHINGDSYKSFIQEKDVESCLFPFQTIYKVMQESSSNNAYLTNAIREVSYDVSNPNKHVFIVSGEVIDETLPLVPAKFANRSHLCPPCDGVNFGFDPA